MLDFFLLTFLLAALADEVQGLSERRARELLLRVAADNKVKLSADLTIPGLR